MTKEEIDIRKDERGKVCQEFWDAIREILYVNQEGESFIDGNIYDIINTIETKEYEDVKD